MYARFVAWVVGRLSVIAALQKRIESLEAAVEFGQSLAAEKDRTIDRLRAQLPVGGRY